MSAFQHVLVATDFGEPAGRALDVAVRLARRFDATLSIVHATALPAASYVAYAEGLYWPTDELARVAETALEELVAKTRRQYPKTDGIAVEGEPWRAILDVAKARGADLVVLGTHGRRGLSRVLLGSVVQKVVRFSPIPVLTVPGAAEREAKDRALADEGRA